MFGAYFSKPLRDSIEYGEPVSNRNLLCMSNISVCKYKQEFVLRLTLISVLFSFILLVVACVGG